MTVRRTKINDTEASMETRIESVLAKVRPYIAMHGGDVRLSKIEDQTATLHISGVCAHCSMADLTYNNLVSGLLKEEVPEIKQIIIEK